MGERMETVGIVLAELTDCFDEEERAMTEKICNGGGGIWRMRIEEGRYFG